jgi:hypothetical protein
MLPVAYWNTAEACLQRPCQLDAISLVEPSPIVIYVIDHLQPEGFPAFFTAERDTAQASTRARDQHEFLAEDQFGWQGKDVSHSSVHVRRADAS